MFSVKASVTGRNMFSESVTPAEILCCCIWQIAAWVCRGVRAFNYVRFCLHWHTCYSSFCFQLFKFY